MTEQHFVYSSADAQVMKNMISNYAKGLMPNFIITGDSAAIQRQCALQITDVMTKYQSISFEGGLKFFTIHIPCFNNMEDSNKGFHRLMQSVSVAAGYYSVYRGIVIAEFSSAWTNKANLHYLDNILAYIKANQGRIVFLLLTPNNKTLLSMLKGTVPCKQIQCCKPDIHEIQNVFSSLTEQYDWKIADSASSSLIDLMRSAAQTDNPIETIHHCAKQLEILCNENQCSERWITSQMLESLYIPTPQVEKKEPRKIGFCLTE